MDDQAFLGNLEADRYEEAKRMAEERWPDRAACLFIYPAEGVPQLRKKLLCKRDGDVYANAIHEAGHAVIARHYGWCVRSVDVHLRMFSAGGFFHATRDCFGRPSLRERSSPGSEARQRHADEQFMVYVLGGPVAESCFRPGRVRWHDHCDLESIRSLLWHYSHENEAAYLKKLRTWTKAIIKQHWPDVEVLARALVRRRALTGEEVDALLENPAP